MGNTNSKYEANTIIDIKNNLNKYGICVIQNVLNTDELLLSTTLLWNFFENITVNEEKVLLHDNTTWNNIHLIKSNKEMFYEYLGAGHSEFMWNLRENEKILTIFSSLYNCSNDELLAIFEGFSFLLPPETTNENWYKQCDEKYYFNNNYFADINKIKFKSFVTINDINENDATISFFEDSTKCFDKLKSKSYKNNSEIKEKYLINKYLNETIKCKAGSLVIWDSRLIHCEIKPKRGRLNPNVKNIAYLSYVPKNYVSANFINNNINNFENMRTYEHLTSDVTQEDNIGINNELSLSQLGFKLIGYTDEYINNLLEFNNL